MYPLRCLIAHPKTQVRDQLRKKCEHAAWLRVLGEAASSAEALELTRHIEYGALFLPPGQMGESSGLELARALQKRPLAPALLFVAQDQGQAFEAFEIGAVDYFTWPASQDRLEQSLDRLRRYSKGPQTTRTTQDSRPNRSSGSGQDRTLRLELKDDEEEDLVKALEQAWSEQPQPKAPDKLPVRESGRTLLVPFERIIFIEAEDDYAFVHTASSKYLTSYRLKHLEGRLAEHRFFRIHRKYLVNLDMVTEVASMPGSNLMLRTAGSTRIELPVSRRRINDLKALLGL